MASFLPFFLVEKKKTAGVAKDRLQLILAHERMGGGAKPEYWQDLQRDLIAVIAKYIPIHLDDIKVSMEREGTLDVLEVKIELPDKSKE